MAMVVAISEYSIAFPEREVHAIEERGESKKEPYLKFVKRKNRQLRNRDITIKQYRKDLKTFKQKKYWK